MSLYLLKTMKIKSVFFIALLCLSCSPRVELKDYELGSDISLLNTTGEQEGLYSIFKPVTLLFIGYTSCPDFCPMTLSKIGRALKGMSTEEQAQVQTIFVSIDPEYDTPEKLAAYQKSFSYPLAAFVTPKEKLNSFLSSWGAFIQFRNQEDSKARIIDHSTYLYALDGNKKVRYLLKRADSPDKITAVIKAVIKETGS